MHKVVLVQRFYANFREGLFESLNENANFYLYCHNVGYGKIKTPKKLKEKSYYKSLLSIRIYKDFILFPFLFFKLIYLKPSIIVAEGGKNTVNNIHVLLYSIIFKKPYLIWDLGKAYMDKKTFTLFKLPYVYIQNYIYKRAKKIYTYNNQGKLYFQKKFPNIETVVLQNTVDTRQIKKILTASAKFPDDIPHSFQNKRLVLGYIGSINKKKNTHALKILESLDDIALIIIGDGEKTYVDELKILFKNIDCAFVGYKHLQELRDYYNILDAVIMPGLGGLTIPQSYAFATCVVAVVADGTEKEIISHNDNGFILEKISDVLDILNNVSRKDLKEKGIRGQEKVFTYYSIENYTRNFLLNL
ncbi:glycosyltransferase [uncultured Winogradskyella sp.]|uniref:glycosyltransferase n=1 Tax=uncultured Winogradskyella sp. TaxID=395353 RepID=UPI002623048F|nr:glycosyltransferase [uncultured Winogradskyella sp.]